jgi:Yip1 domain
MSIYNPWFFVWVKPKKVIKQLLEQEHKKSLWPLAVLHTCIYSGFSWIWLRSLSVFVIETLLLAVCVYVGFVVSGWLLVLTGRWLGGKGSPDKTRVAVGWATVPLIVSTSAYLTSITLFLGQRVEASSLWLLVLSSVAILATIWWAVIYVIMIAEVQRFSIWRAIVNAVLAALVCSVIWISILFVVSLFRGVP